MKIEKGWIKWENAGESLDIELLSIKYNKNGKPYAVARKLTPLTEAEPSIYKFNIAQSDIGLKKGRYTVKCTHANNGFGFVEFKPMQDLSWDIHDETSAVEDEVAMDMEMLLPQHDMSEVEEVEELISAILHARKLYNKWSMKDHDCSDCDCHYDGFEDILDEVYSEYGKLKYNIGG